MTDTVNESAQRIADGGRAALLDLLRPAFERQAQSRAGALELDGPALERLVAAAADRADGVLWRRALAEVGRAELGVELAEAVLHPAVERAHVLAGAPAWTPPVVARRLQAVELAVPGPVEVDDAPPAGVPAGGSATAPGRAPETDEADDDDGGIESGRGAMQALRLAAVHLGGIETVRQGDRDIELRLSAAGLDVLRRSSGVAIGRLEWDEIETIELPRARRGLRPGKRKAQELHVATDRGQASFELPGLSDEQVKEHLEPMLAHARAPIDHS
ncbi:MAG: hypothetical protein ABSH51_12095 [Solirubrobacteraceae bacterium]|jgi:hypothetical protein